MDPVPTTGAAPTDAGPTWVALGRPGGRARWVVELADGRALAVFDVDGEYRVIDARCPHARGPLGEGAIEDGYTLVCPGHRFRYDLRSGACANHNRYDLRFFPVEVRDGVVHAAVAQR